MKTIVIVVAVVLAVPALAHAQNWGRPGGYTIITPGAPPTFVNPSLNGGYTAITPGQPPTFINPSLNGGYTVITPGRSPTFIDPTIPQIPRAPIYGGDAAGDD